MHRYSLCLLAAFLLGCGSAPAPAPVAEKPKKAPKVELPPPPPPVTVTPNEFPSIAAAVEELEKSLKLPDGQEQNRAVTRCRLWMKLKNEKAAEEFGKIVQNPSASFPLRITACLFLPDYGAAATEPLLAVAEKSDNAQLRRKAIESLGRLKPVDRKTIDLLIALIQEKDIQIVQQAINSLALIGEPATDAADLLSDLRQNSNEEAIRVAAGEALKKVSPRKQFTDK